jgi:hypothetical protein
MIVVSHVAIESRVQYGALEEAGSVVGAVESECMERRATSRDSLTSSSSGT